MKNLAILISISIVFSSCTLYRFQPDLYQEQPKPYVELKDGKVIQANNVSIRHKFLEEKEIVADSSAYRESDVAFYSDGWYQYANATRFGYPTFVRKIMSGKINVYNTISNSVDPTVTPLGSIGSHPQWRDAGRNSWDHYIQKANSKEVVHLSYNNLKSMIPANAAAYHHLKKFKTTRNVTWVTAAVGAVGIVSGIAYMSYANRNDYATDAGFFMAFGGVCVLAPSIIIKGRNSAKLRKAVRDYNRE